MPSPWSFLSGLLHVPYLQVTSVPHLKTAPHLKTPQLPPEKWDPKQPHGPSPWKQGMMGQSCALAGWSRRPVFLHTMPSPEGHKMKSVLVSVMNGLRVLPSVK